MVGDVQPGRDLGTRHPLPTADRAARAELTLERIDKLRRDALEFAHQLPALRQVIDDAVGGDYRTRDLDHRQRRCCSWSVAATVRALNNRGSTRVADAAATAAGTGLSMTISDLQRRNAEFWSKNRADFTGQI